MWKHSIENFRLIAYGKFSKIVTSSTEKFLNVKSGVGTRSSRVPLMRFSHLVFAVWNTVSLNPEAGHIFVKINQKLCANAPQRAPQQI